MNSGRQRVGIARDTLKKKHFIFKTLQKMVKKLGYLKSFNVEKGPGFVNCRNFDKFFCIVFK